MLSTESGWTTAKPPETATEYEYVPSPVLLVGTAKHTEELLVVTTLLNDLDQARS